MGNSSSSDKPQEDDKLYKEINFIATNYITTQSFQDMKNLANMEYCNDLAVMTADIIAKNLNEQQVKYLAQRLKDGVEINEMTEGNIVYAKKSALPNLDVSNATTKRRICIGIAKFYVKAAHLFAAVVTTINPVYIYKDSTGKLVKTTLMRKNEIPKDASAKVEKYNLCSSRINALVNKTDFNVPSDSKVTIAPRFCDMNYDKTRRRDRNLGEEPGIPELEKLYYDEYDFDEGGFTGMSKEMREEVYEKDVLTFYRAFTGNKDLPTDDAGKPLVTKFSQILLRDFHKSEVVNRKGAYTQGYTATLKNKLFAQYAEHIKTMMQNAESNQDGLMAILKGDKTTKPPLEGLFSQIINPSSGKKEAIINPNLTPDGLQTLIVKAREIIVSLYVQCEDDFVKGLGIFEAIVEKQLMETSQAQMDKLNATLQESLTEVSELTGTTNSSGGESPDSDTPLTLINEIPEPPTKDVGIDNITSASTDGGMDTTMNVSGNTETNNSKIEEIKKDLAKELRDAQSKIKSLEQTQQQGPYMQAAVPAVPVLLPTMNQPSLVNPTADDYADVQKHPERSDILDAIIFSP